MTNQEKNHLLIKFCRAMFEKVIGTDIKNVSALPVEMEFLQGKDGVQISFVVSHHFIGKTDPEAQKSLYKLMEELKKQSDYSYPDK